ncbi:hypothetical protein GCM10010428_34120 [Actinosynnema pretiosum subsp. pretiosum]
MVTAVSKGDFAEGLMNVAGGALGVSGFLADPLAGLFSAGFGWLMEHVWFLKEPLDWLTGDQQQLDVMTKTWGNVGTRFDQVANDLKGWVGADAAQWEGDEFRAYERWAKDRADSYAAVGSGASAVSVLVTVCKTILNVVRGIVRDLIAEAAGKFVSICIRWGPAMAAFGAGVAGAVAECVTLAIGYARKIMDWCKRLSTAFRNAQGLFQRAGAIFDAVREALSRTVGTGLVQYAAKEARQGAVETIKNTPAMAHKLLVDFGKEGAKSVDRVTGDLFADEKKNGQG